LGNGWGPGPYKHDVVVYYRLMPIGHLENHEKRCEVQYVDDKP